MKFFPLMTFLLVLILASCSEENGQPTNQPEEPDKLKSGKSKIFVVSTAFNDPNKSAFLDETDFIWDQGEDTSNPFACVHTKVTGIRGLLHGINLMGEGQGRGSWKLFKDENIDFNLKDIQELLETDQSELDEEGHLSSLIFYVSYLDIDLQFKGVKSTLRCYYKDDSETSAKEGDILYLDPSDNTFKWVVVDGRKLHKERPTSTVACINFHNLNKGKKNVIVFGADNYTDIEWINNPPPWTDSGHRKGSITFYDLTEENFVKDHDIVIDLSMMKAAMFSAHPHIKDGSHFSNEKPWFNYAIPYEGLEKITDMEGNALTSEEFTILDILPGLLLPYCMCNVKVADK